MCEGLLVVPLLYVSAMWFGTAMAVPTMAYGGVAAAVRAAPAPGQMASITWSVVVTMAGWIGLAAWATLWPVRRRSHREP